MLKLCFARNSTGALQKVDIIVMKDDYVEIPKQHFSTSSGKVQPDNDLNQTSKLQPNALKTAKSNLPKEHLWTEVEKHEDPVAHKPVHSVKNEQKIHWIN